MINCHEYNDVITRKIVFLDKENSLIVQCITREFRIHIYIRKVKNIVTKKSNKRNNKKKTKSQDYNMK